MSKNEATTEIRIRCTKEEDVLIAERFYNLCDDEDYVTRKVILRLVDEWTRTKCLQINGQEYFDSLYGGTSDSSEMPDFFNDDLNDVLPENAAENAAENKL